MICTDSLNNVQFKSKVLFCFVCSPATFEPGFSSQETLSTAEIQQLQSCFVNGTDCPELAYFPQNNLSKYHCWSPHSNLLTFTDKSKNFDSDFRLYLEHLRLHLEHLRLHTEHFKLYPEYFSLYLEQFRPYWEHLRLYQECLLLGTFETLLGTFETSPGTFETLPGIFETLIGTFET